MAWNKQGKNALPRITHYAYYFALHSSTAETTCILNKFTAVYVYLKHSRHGLITKPLDGACRSLLSAPPRQLAPVFLLLNALQKGYRLKGVASAAWVIERDPRHVRECRGVDKSAECTCFRI